MRPGGLRDPLSTDHPRQLFDTGVGIEKHHFRSRAAAINLLFDPRMPVSESGDLGEMSHTEDLVGPGQFLQLPTDWNDCL